MQEKVFGLPAEMQPTSAAASAVSGGVVSSLLGRASGCARQLPAGAGCLVAVFNKDVRQAACLGIHFDFTFHGNVVALLGVCRTFGIVSGHLFRIGSEMVKFLYRVIGL